MADAKADKKPRKARKLTAKQEAYTNLRIKGSNGPDAYRKVYKSKGTSYTVSNEAARLDRHPLIAPKLEAARNKASEEVQITTEGILKRLAKESGYFGDNDVPEDSTQTARVAALKMMGDYAGGFDKNKHKVDMGEAVSFNMTFGNK